MKTLLITFKLLVLTVISSLPGKAQGAGDYTDVLGKFSVQENDRIALIDWTIKGGRGCSSFYIEHSTDGVNFKQFYKYPGFCGGEPVDIKFFTHHKNPAKGMTNYYRLNLGEFGYSNVESFYVHRETEQGYSMYPMPATAQTVLHFKNPLQSPYRFSLLDTNGRERYSKSGITSEEVAIGAIGLAPGTYFFTLIGNNERLTGKVLQQ